jgi:hypothetical protein
MIMQIKFVLILFCFLIAIQTIKSEELKVVTIKKDTVNLIEYANNKNLYVILFSCKYICFDCFNNIVKSLDSLQHYNTNISYVFLAESSNSSYERRKQIEMINQIRNDLNIYFDINENIFNRYKVDKTPAIININNSKIKYFPSNMFSKTIKETMRNLILKSNTK